MTHDRLFKELLISFFYEFLELFFADLANQIDRLHPPVFLDKETFGANRREKDLVARVRFHSGEACFIVHIEHEAQNNRNFPQRMHLYFARLLERYGSPIYPIAVFSRRSRKPREGATNFSSASTKFWTFVTLHWNWRYFGGICLGTIPTRLPAH